MCVHSPEAELNPCAHTGGQNQLPKLSSDLQQHMCPPHKRSHTFFTNTRLCTCSLSHTHTHMHTQREKKEKENHALPQLEIFSSALVLPFFFLFPHFPKTNDLHCTQAGRKGRKGETYPPWFNLPWSPRGVWSEAS